jgi:hypothetical protein
VLSRGFNPDRSGFSHLREALQFFGLTGRHQVANPLAISELMRTIQWRALSTQQKAFCAKFIVSTKRTGVGDAVAAVRVAYPGIRDSKIWASRLLSNPRIKKVLALYFGMTDAEVLLADIRALVKRSRRRGANMDNLVPMWLRVAAALEALIAKEHSHANS